MCWPRARPTRRPNSGAARARAMPGATATSASRRRAPPARPARAPPAPRPARRRAGCNPNPGVGCMAAHPIRCGARVGHAGPPAMSYMYTLTSGMCWTRGAGASRPPMPPARDAAWLRPAQASRAGPRRPRRSRRPLSRALATRRPTRRRCPRRQPSLQRRPEPPPQAPLARAAGVGARPPQRGCRRRRGCGRPGSPGALAPSAASRAASWGAWTARQSRREETAEAQVPPAV